MSHEREARGIVDASSYLTLATADRDGRPWVSPVWYAHDAYREFLWASRPETRHSRNLVTRPQVAIVIFESGLAPSSAQGVYVEAEAEELRADDLDRAIEVYSGRSEKRGLQPWTAADVSPPAAHRLYRATASAHYVLGAGDERVPVELR